MSEGTRGKDLGLRVEEEERLGAVNPISSKPCCLFFFFFSVIAAMNLNVASKSSDSNWSGRLMVSTDEASMPSLLYSVVHLLMLVAMSAFATIGMVYHGDVPWLPPHSLDCCAGLHVALGFFCWYWPPILIACIMYQVMDR